MTDCETKNVGSWDKYLDKWLTAEDVESVTDYYTVTKVEEAEYKDKKKIRLTLRGDKDTYLYDLNIVNTKFLRKEKVKHPADIVDLKLAFRKVTVTNPSTQQEVEALRIDKVVGVVTDEKVGN